eukprot:3906805-Amphidinium_carterae.2
MGGEVAMYKSAELCETLRACSNYPECGQSECWSHAAYLESCSNITSPMSVLSGDSYGNATSLKSESWCRRSSGAVPFPTLLTLL